MNKIYTSFLENCKNIEDYYENLVELTKNHNYVGSTNEWIIDNYYLVVENKNFIKKVFKEKKNIKTVLYVNEKMYRILINIFNKHNYNLDKATLLKELNHYQNKNSCYFSYPTINVIPVLIPIILIDELNKLCIKREEKQVDILKVKNLMDRIDRDRANGISVNLDDYIDIDDYLLKHPVYLYHLNASLKELGEESDAIFQKLNEFLEENKVDLKEVINQEHLSSIEDNILVSNLFNNLRTLSKLEVNELCDKISKTEKLLLTNSVYKNMTQESKLLYRRQIIANTKKIDEYKYVNDIVEKTSKNGKEIADYLFKKKNTNRIFYLYITLIILMVVIICYFLSFHLLDNFIICFLLLLVPVSEVVIQVVNKLFMKFNKPKALPKLDFSKGIPKEYSTMVVIPTIIKDTKKIDNMYKCLEKYYLANKTPNLYFTLLADCMEYSKEVYENDSVIASYGVEKANELNQKYGKEMFFFMYRKRVYNPSEGKYLGYERKRGGLLHFNKLLLGRLSKEEKEKYVYVETLSNLKCNIKYVITYDADAESVFNSAQSLVGLMAHPSNRAVLNKEKTKVVKGYGIVQPRVSVDIESTNQSTYSQLMAGIGGFDVYSSIVPNFYQDVFDEGSFVGKGIYDLEVFDTVIGDKFPENLILSHDLLEGNYLRCGYTSDIEIFEDFPAEFLVEMSRQHRWARGDFQISGWLFSHVRNKKKEKVKNPLNPVEKFKIFDNLRRYFVNSSMLLLLLLSFVMGNAILTTVVVLLIISLPIFFYLREIFSIEKRTVASFKHYDSLTYGTTALFSRLYINFITIPYVAYMHINAMCKSFYRMFISHKNLLNWLTAEDASKVINSKLSTYISAFKPNYVTVVLIILLVIIHPENLMIGLIVILSFLIAPFILWLVSKKNLKEVERLNEKDIEELSDVAYRTWLYFDYLLNEENNYLIPDNYQVNREVKEDVKTSPTDIGMSIVSIVSACELGFIKREHAIKILDKVISSVEKLEKWNGFIYCWYNVKTMQKMYPYDISSVDNGNLAASFLVAKEFARDNGSIDLMNRIETLFDNMDFSKLYTDKDVFSVTYHTTEEKLSIYNYNKFASESRLLGFVAIAKGDVSFKHWMCLDKSLIRFKKYKGLTSWSGTSFEYFMPAIFMKSYPNTLLDESYFFALYCQKEYMKEVDTNMPWGISESAYGELDDGLNYKYKAFSTPYLKVQEDKEQEIVISPYASILAITTNPKEVYHNINKLKEIGLYSDFGFFESYDYDDKEVVLSYFSHHQGMILASLANYLKKDVIRNYFHHDVRVQSIEILLKEKIQFNPIIDLKIYGYKKYNYEKEIVENDIREFNYLSLIPEVSVLSNNDYLLLINDRGNGFSRYKKIQLNRYRKITEQDYGMFVYIKDVESGKFWSNTYSPTNVEPDKYNIVFASDRINFIRQDGFITTKTEIIVTKEHNAEIRKITLRNHSNKDKKLEVTTYTEPIIIENIDDITHRTFKNLFVSSEYDSLHESVVMCRKDNNKKIVQYLFNRLLVLEDEHYISYETERASFIGRNRNTNYPLALSKSGSLSNHVGTNIDPVISLRTNIVIPKNSEKVVYYISGYSKSRDQIDIILDAYDTEAKIKTAFEYATLANNINTKLLGVNGPDMRHYNIMLNYLYQTSRHFINPERKDILTKNSMNQTNLWKYGITGDYPIILVEVHESESLNLVKEVLKAYEFYKSRSIFVDIVIINREKDEYKPIIKREIEKEKYRMNTLYDFMATPGEIFVLDDNDVNDQETILLNMVARLRFDTRRSTSLEDSIETLQKENKMISYKPIEYEKSIGDDFDGHSLLFYNDFGGFSSDGSEYIITNPDTPTPWCNVLANDKFGSIVTNNECGFTYAYNSQMFKITSWTNDIVLNDKSEGIRVDDKVVNPIRAVHGFGYSTFVHNTSNYSMDTTHFVSSCDTVKFYKVHFKNKCKSRKKYKLTFWINPTFGPNEEKSSRYLLSDYYEEMNSVLIRNVYNTNFSHVTAFMSSTLPITGYSIDKIIFKSIEVEIEVDAGEMKEFSFLLGTEIGNDQVLSLVKKYNSNDKIERELETVKSDWMKKLGIIKVKTPDQSFNTIINGWYLYQTISARLNAKAGFYQVGGAFGYRDQLQDAVNLCIVDEERTKNQIINNAKHQFIEGDVLHWWHEIIKMGLRSRYKDDFLWLVYAVNQYVKISGDYQFLDEKVEFVSGQELLEGEAERGITYTYTSDKATIYEHCLISLEKSMNELGENGLPLMGGGDWNDGMNKVGIQGKGTSVWLGFFLYMVMRDFIALSQKYKKLKVDKYVVFLDKLKDSLNRVSWDGDYYLRAFFDNGDMLGSHLNDECKIDLISQSFSILSLVIPKERIESVIQSVEKYLVDPDLKIIKLLTPPFSKSLNNPGYIMDYPTGIRENGGQYTHSTAWYIMALIQLGENERAYNYYQMINPINRSLNKKAVKTYKVEPYVIAADIYSNHSNPARGGWTWYTGSSGWFYQVGIVEILGFKKEGNTLRIKPSVPNSWSSFEIEYRYMDTLYKIKVNFNDTENIVIDGDKSSKDFITLKNDKRLHAVIVNIRRNG